MKYHALFVILKKRQNLKLSSAAIYRWCFKGYNAFNVYRRELAPGTVSLTGYRAQGDDSQHCAYCNMKLYIVYSFCLCVERARY